jgi:hypothetical protein
VAKITLDALKAKSACKKQVDLFESLYGAGVTVSRERCIDAVDKFDFTWAASHLLTPAAWHIFVTDVADARAAYDRARQEAWAKHGCASYASRAAYEADTDAAWSAYLRARAAAFADAYNSQ